MRAAARRLTDEVPDHPDQRRVLSWPHLPAGPQGLVRAKQEGATDIFDTRRPAPHVLCMLDGDGLIKASAKQRQSFKLRCSSPELLKTCSAFIWNTARQVEVSLREGPDDLSLIGTYTVPEAGDYSLQLTFPDATVQIILVEAVTDSFRVPFESHLLEMLSELELEATRYSGDGSRSLLSWWKGERTGLKTKTRYCWLRQAEAIEARISALDAVARADARERKGLLDGIKAVQLRVAYSCCELKSPMPLRVWKQAAPLHCWAWGDGLWAACVGVEATFEIHVIGEDLTEMPFHQERVRVLIDTLEHVCVQRRDHDRSVYDVVYRPSQGGSYDIAVLLGETHIGGSPFSVLVHGTVGNTGPYEFGNGELGHLGHLGRDAEDCVVGPNEIPVVSRSQELGEPDEDRICACEGPQLLDRKVEHERSSDDVAGQTDQVHTQCDGTFETPHETGSTSVHFEPLECLQTAFGLEVTSVVFKPTGFDGGSNLKRPLLHVAVDGAAAFLKHMWAADGNVEVELTPALVRGRLAVSITKVHPGV